MKHNLVKAAYIACVIIAAYYCFKRPMYDWDMLPYSTLILRMDGYDEKSAFAGAYKSAKENLPPKSYHLLTDSTNAYRHKLANNREAFNKQLPFYVVKPLYTSISYLAYKAAFSLPQATIIPSVISYLLMAFLLFRWLNVYLRLPISFFLSLLIMISTPFIHVAKLSTPDGLSALLLLASFYFAIQKPSLVFAVVCMCLSVFARMDNIICCLVLITAIYVSETWHLSLKSFLLIILLFAFCYIIVGLFAWRYGWSVFFYNEFASHLHPVYGSGKHFTPRAYFRLMYEHFMSAINSSYFTIFMALHVLNIAASLSSKKFSIDRLIALLIPAVLFIRFLLYPDISDRFYIAYYLVIVVLLVRNFSALFPLPRVTPRKDSSAA